MDDRQTEPDWVAPLRKLRDEAPIYVASPLGELVEALAAAQDKPRFPLICLYEAVEAIIRFLTLASLAEAAAASPEALPRKLSQELRSTIDRPTFNVWRLAFNHVARTLRDKSLLLPELRHAHAALTPLFATKDQATEETDIIELRNRLAHGGGILRERSSRLLEIWAPRVGEAIRSLSWLGDLDLWAVDQTGCRLLKGTRPEGLALPCPQSLAGQLQVGDIVLVRGDWRVWLKPFGRHAPGGPSGPSVAQIYVRLARRPDMLLYSLIGSAQALQAPGDDAALRRFRELFDFGAPPPPQPNYSEPGFDAEIAAAAEAFVGRSGELERLLGAIRETKTGVLWIQGVAGAGKSTLVARAAVDLADDVACRVLIYPFRQGYGRCSTMDFLRWLVERLDTDKGTTILNRVEGRFHFAGMRSDLLQAARDRLSADRAERIVLFMDGLDELERMEAGASAEILCALVPEAKSVVFVLAGQPIAGLPALIDRLGGRNLFDGDLRPTSKVELREMIDHEFPEVTPRLVRQDRGDEVVANPFVDRLATLAQGLPDNLRLVFEGMKNSRFIEFDSADAARLPPALRQSVRDLFRTPVVDDIDVHKRWIIGLLATAFEPMTVDLLAALIGRGLGSTTPGVETTWQAIGGLGGYVDRMTTPDGIAAYALATDAIRAEFLDAPECASVREQVAEALRAAALSPAGDAASAYLMRRGVQHLLAAGHGADAAALLSDVRYQLRRLKALGVDGLRADWARVADAGVALTPAQSDWLAFWATDGVRLRREAAADSAVGFVECAWTYAANSTVGAAIRGLDDPEAKPRLVFEIGYRRPGRVEAIFRGHRDTIKGALELADRRILSWSKDGTLRLWGATGTPIGEPVVVERAVESALLLSNGRVVTWASPPDVFSPEAGPQLHLWRFDGATPASLRLDSPDHPVLSWGAIEAPGGRLLAGDRSTTTALQAWTLDGDRLPSMPVPEALPLVSFAQAISGGRLLLGGKSTLVACSAAGAALGPAMTGGPAEYPDTWVERAVELSSGDFVVLARKDATRLWSADGSPVAVLRQWANDAIELADGRIVGCDGRETKVFEATGEPAASPALGALQWIRRLRDGSFLCLHGAPGDHPILAVLGQTLQPLDWFDDASVGDIAGALELADGDVLIWAADFDLYLWNRHKKRAALGTALVQDAKLRARRDLRRVRQQADNLSRKAARLADMDAAALGNAARDAVARVGDTAAAILHRGLWAGRDSWWRRDGSLIGHVGNAGLRFARRGWAELQALGDEEGRSAAHLLATRSRLPYVGLCELASGRFISWEYDGRLQLWSVYGEPIYHTGKFTYALGAIAVGGERFMYWTPKGEVHIGSPSHYRGDEWLFHFEGLPKTPHGGARVTTIVRLPDGRFLSGAIDGTLRLWTAAPLPSGEVITGHRAVILGLAGLADGRLVSWSADHELRLWTGDGQFIRRHLLWGGTPLDTPDGLVLDTPEHYVRCRLT